METFRALPWLKSLTLSMLVWSSQVSFDCPCTLFALTLKTLDRTTKGTSWMMSPCWSGWSTCGSRSIWALRQDGSWLEGSQKVGVRVDEGQRLAEVHRERRRQILIGDERLQVIPRGHQVRRGGDAA